MATKKLAGKVAIITGGASGIGRASAFLFAKEGAKVAVADLDRGGQKVANDIRVKNGNALFIRTDVSISNDVKSMIRLTVEKWGKLDIIFNNAGVALNKFLPDLREEDWDRLIDVNLKGVFLGSKYAFKQMLNQGAGGSIVNMSSVLGLVSLQGNSAYSASKSGIIGLTKGIAIDGGPYNIRANCICPGFILTRMTENSSKKDLRREAKIHPLARVGRDVEVARAALFLASDESSFVTGSVLTVDGGLSAASPETALRTL